MTQNESPQVIGLALPLPLLVLLALTARRLINFDRGVGLCGAAVVVGQAAVPFVLHRYQ